MTHRQRKLKRRRRHTGRSSVLLGLAVLATVSIIAVLSAIGYVLAIAASAPDLSELKPADKGQLSAVYAVDGSRLGFIQSDVLRRVVPWRDIPVNLRRATVAIEDERFYKHGGVDLNAIVRAGIKNLESGKTVQGGSTITQQLVRALYIKDPKRDFARKIREAKLASELEDEHSKTWILHNYLNSVPYGTVGGRTAIGVEAAAVTFFDKHAKNLDLAESAMIAGLPQAPSQYNPFRNEQAAIQRRNEVHQADGLEPLHHAGGGGRGHPAAGAAEARHPLRHAPRAVHVRLRPGAADRALRLRSGPPRRPADPHHDQPQGAGPRSAGDRGPALRPERSLGRDRDDRPVERLHPRDGVQHEVPGPHLQPRGAGPPPARLLVQDDGAHRRDPRRDRPEPHDVRLEAADDRRSRTRGSTTGRSQTYGRTRTAAR